MSIERQRSIVLGPIVLGIAALPVASLAQQPASTQAETAGGLQEVVVTAERREASLQSVPVAVSRSYCVPGAGPLPGVKVYHTSARARRFSAGNAGDISAWLFVPVKQGASRVSTTAPEQLSFAGFAG